MLKRLIGDEGERLAAAFLVKNGYKILTKNFANKYGEIDIIALETKKARKLREEYDIMPKAIKDEDVIVFVEVKYRTSDKFGKPFEAVDTKKQKRYELLSNVFLLENNFRGMQFRFDIIEILGKSINHIVNAF